MNKNNNLIRNPKYKKASRIMTVVGAVFLALGIAFVVTSAVFMTKDIEGTFMLSAVFGSLGVFSIGVGMMLLVVSLSGAFSRFFVSQQAETHKDYVNYMRQETEESAKEYYQNVFSGKDTVICPHCQSENPREARFCGHCGEELNITSECPYCHHENPADSNYCNQCGRKL